MVSQESIDAAISAIKENTAAIIQLADAIKGVTLTFNVVRNNYNPNDVRNQPEFRG